MKRISGLSLPLTPPFSCPACPRSLVFILPLPHLYLTRRLIDPSRPSRSSVSIIVYLAPTERKTKEPTKWDRIAPMYSSPCGRDERIKIRGSLERRKPRLYPIFSPCLQDAREIRTRSDCTTISCRITTSWYVQWSTSQTPSPLRSSSSSRSSSMW